MINKKLVSFSITILFISVSVIPSTGNIMFFDDSTPPVTTHEPDPPEPDGENGWYVSDVEVTLNATDDMSGVKEIRYTINSGPERVIPGDSGSFILSEDGEDIEIEYWAVDNAGNVEQKNSFTIDMDQTPPETLLYYEIIGGNPWQGWDILFGLVAADDMSSVNITYYRFNGGEWEIYVSPFVYTGDVIFIEFYSIDNAGNQESYKNATFNLAASVSSNTIKSIEKKESPLYGIRTRRAIGERLGRIIDFIKTRFLGERIFFLPFQWIRTIISESFTILSPATFCSSGCKVCATMP